MAELYWQGATAGSGIKRFDFSTPSNWKVRRYGLPAVLWPTSATAPGNNDIVNFGTGFTAQSPCLYGGYSGGVGFGQWRNAISNPTYGLGGTGTTQQTSLQQARMYLNTNYYPFPYFGGGITGDVYNYCVNVLSLDATEITGATATFVNNGLTLKTLYNNLLSTTGRLSSSYDVGGKDGNGYPNYTVVNLKCVQSKGTSLGATANTPTEFNIGSDVFTFSANETFYDSTVVGFGDVTINNGAFRAIQIQDGISGVAGLSGAPARALKIYFNGVTAGSISTPNCDLQVDQNCTVGSFTVRTGVNPYYASERISGLDGREIILAGKFNYDSVVASIGAVPGITQGNPFTSGVFLYDQFTHRPGNRNYDYEPTILISTPEDGVTFSAQNLLVFTELAPYSGATGNSQRPWVIEFFGDATVGSMSVEGTRVRANRQTPPTKQFNITNLNLAEASVLDLRHAPNSDNWFFGAISGSGASASIQGGINFRDDTSRIVGSSGVRLYNTKIVSNFDVRSGTAVPTPSYAVPFEDAFIGGKF